MNLTDIPAGAIALARIPGALGWAINTGQAAIAGDSSRWTHVGIVTAPYIDALRPGAVVEAMPGGAREVSLRYFVRSERPALFAWRDTTPDQQAALVRYAVAQTDPPARYSYTSYFALMWPRKTRPAWITQRVLAKPGSICSVLTDEDYNQAGLPLFSDGRQRFDVTPGDIANLIADDDDAWTTLRVGNRGDR